MQNRNRVPRTFLRSISDSLPFIYKNRTAIILCAILALGAYLRLNDFAELARFGQDQVRDARVVEQMHQGEFPLLGPKAGGTEFKLGPAFYYLQYVSGILFGFDEAGIAMFIPLLSIGAVFLMFVLLRAYFSRELALALTALYAVSFFAIKYARFAWNPNAIAFFLLVFLLSAMRISEKQKEGRLAWHIALGASLGIAMQLHTILLLLLPVMGALVYLYSFYFSKNFSLKGLLFAIFTMAALNIPFVLHELTFSGANTRAFLSGGAAKTADSSLLGNILSSTTLFAQGSAYVLTGNEPQKDWANATKLLRSGDWTEIFLAAAAFAFLAYGSFLFLKKLRSEQKDESERLLLLLGSFSVLSFILFSFLGSELNLRFFIVLPFFPLLWLGFIAQKTLSFFPGRKGTFFLFSFFALFIFSNLRTYSQVYDLDNYKAPDSAYGGISLGETRRICDWIRQDSRAMQEPFFLYPSEWDKSLKYSCRKDQFDIPSFSEKSSPDKAAVFIVVETKHAAKKKGSLSPEFHLICEKQSGRYTLLLFLYEESPPLKIGFITDIHAKRSKSAGGFLDETESRTVQYFVSQMNKSFHPRLVVQGGDFIEGTNRRGPKSIEDFKAITERFEGLQTQLLHVLGNHDMRGLSKAEWAVLTKKDSTYYFMDVDNYRIIILDGNENEEMGLNDGDYYGYFMSDKQLLWLEEALSSSAAKKAVFIHYPPVNPKVNAGDKILDQKQAEKIHALFAENNVLAVFSGHVEQLQMNERDGIRYFIIPGLDRSSRKAVPWYESFAEITIKEDAQVDLYYKKVIGESPYKKIHIPSDEFILAEK